MATILTALAALLLAAYPLIYSVWANLRWPAEGERLATPFGRIHVITRGAGEPVLFLHGASANAREFLSLEGMRLDDHRLLFMDRPGLGHSSRPQNAHTLKVQAQAAAAVLEAMAAAPAIVVAHSLGCATALRLALDRPELVRGLVLIAPASHPYPGENVWYARVASVPVLGELFAWLFVPLVGPLMLKAAVRNTFAPAPTPARYISEAGVPLVLRPRSFVTNARDVTATKREFVAQAPRYRDLLTPTVVITADADKVVAPSIHAFPLAAEMPAAELVIAPGTGHMPHRISPHLVAAAIRRISTRTSARRGDAAATL